MERKALVIGVDLYNGNFPPLKGCVSDAEAVKGVLDFHGTNPPEENFDVEILGTEEDGLSKYDLRNRALALFRNEALEIALFYFAGHGSAADRGGQLLATDSEDEMDGLPVHNLLEWANNSTATNRLVILDSCYSGAAGGNGADPEVAELRPGVTIMTSSTARQTASDGGVFTSLFVNAMQGEAKNLLGHITPGSVYAHIDQSLGVSDQRPVFKTNVKRFVSLRKVQPDVEIDELRRIVEFFPEPGMKYHLDPSYEKGPVPDPQHPDPNHHPDPAKIEIFTILQKFTGRHLVEPVDATAMYYAAMNQKCCRLTDLGEFYRRLVAEGRFGPVPVARAAAKAKTPSRKAGTTSRNAGSASRKGGTTGRNARHR